MKLMQWLRWLWSPRSPSVSEQWEREQRRRELGRGVDLPAIDWEAMKRREP